MLPVVSLSKKLLVVGPVFVSIGFVDMLDVVVEYCHRQLSGVAVMLDVLVEYCPRQSDTPGCVQTL